MIDALAPRSTWIHCGSENALDQRVLVLPSTAFEAGNEAFSTDEAVAGWPCDSSVEAAAARLAGPATKARAAASAITTATIQALRHANDLRTRTPEPMIDPCPREEASPVPMPDQACSKAYFKT